MSLSNTGWLVRSWIVLLLTLQLTRSRGSSGLLYTQKKFGWTVTDYTNYQSFWVVHMSVKVEDKFSHLQIVLSPRSSGGVTNITFYCLQSTETKLQQYVFYHVQKSYSDAASGFHSDAFSLLLPASARLHDRHSRYRRSFIIIAPFYIPSLC